MNFAREVGRENKDIIDYLTGKGYMMHGRPSVRFLTMKSKISVLNSAQL